MTLPISDGGIDCKLQGDSWSACLGLVLFIGLIVLVFSPLLTRNAPIALVIRAMMTARLVVAVLRWR